VRVFRVGITSDLVAGTVPDGWLARPRAEVLDPLPDVECDLLAESVPEIRPEVVRGYDAVISGAPRWTRESVRGDKRLALIVRWGAGVDEVDLDSATKAGIVVATSPASGNRAAVAESVLAFILALSKNLLAKNRLTKQGRALEAQELSGALVAGRVIGIIGFGGTGQALAEFLRPLKPARIVAYDPYVADEVLGRLDVIATDLESLVRDSDYVAVMCSLTKETHHLIGSELLALMKPTAYLVNAARGPIVDQAALTRALLERRIAGAAIDVFEPEPPPHDEPLLALEDVVTTGHAIAWTTESLYECSLEACRAVASVYHGLLPAYVANPDVLGRANLRVKIDSAPDRREGSVEGAA
jgi:phosphoglycerate dehydrogenase-like enzyme